MVFQVPGLRAGSHLHRYFLNVARPGSAVLPPPALIDGAARLPVTVEPADLRILVLSAGN
jgi:hypothetical protein